MRLIYTRTRIGVGLSEMLELRGLSMEIKTIAVAGDEPEWVRTAGYAENGDVFAPSAITGNEKVAFMCAAFDGVPMFVLDGHPFFPTHWLATEYPETAELCTKIEARVRSHFEPSNV